MKFKIGSKYTIQFWDHAIGVAPVMCEVTMWITGEDKTHVEGTWWRIVSDAEIEKDNRELVHIIKSTIVKKVKLK